MCSETFSRTGAQQKRVPTSQRMLDSSVTFSGPCVPLYGVLGHLKVYFMQHDFLWLGGGSSCTPYVKSEVHNVTVVILNSW